MVVLTPATEVLDEFPSHQHFITLCLFAITVSCGRNLVALRGIHLNRNSLS